MSLTINLEHPLYVGFKLVFREQTGVKYPLSETNHLRKNGCCISGISTSIHVTDLFTFKQKSIICYTINGFFFISQKLRSNMQLRIVHQNRFWNIWIKMSQNHFLNMKCHRSLSIDHFVYKYEPFNQWWIFCKNNLFVSLNPPPLHPEKK